MTKRVIDLLFPLFVFLIFSLPLQSKEVHYEVYYGLFPAGEIKIDFAPQKVVVKGKSGGLLGLFYKYRLYLVYDLKNPSSSFMVEKENGKERRFNYQKLLKKKAWLPMVIKLLLHRGDIKKGKVLKVGEYRVVPKEVIGNDYYFLVEGSKRTKAISLKGWKSNRFPERIEIETSSGTIILQRED